ncbi:class I SAM-dependent methyltransferase [Clostridium sp. MD294]|uniref:tRNA (adenine(22)-N(1))-methyltransferase n=1 Tax=Clostridium sp. MD294 TaxID=97138 RepID=UPI0002CC368E|nr:class I SAM-dependent methyltransferase [Clostridium sp. MD294]NDO46564.1 SAM-dependent methyltransferase [Clostridium sp. MD294]USF29005.1 tRNA (adenine(22)-N(1))-methyltransferase [Clostridium sp. MD294]
MLELSRRLRCVGDFVTQKTVADIGTDHAYIPIYLHKKGKAEKIIACDINQKPLQKAQQNIKAHHAENVIVTRLGNGLQTLQPNEVDTVIISGMGGMLIIELLKQSKEIVDTVKEFVLCPHLDVPAVRKYLHYIGYSIVDEKMILEDDIFYTILRAIKGEQKYSKEIEYLFGKILLDSKDTVLKQFILNEKNRLQNIQLQLCDKKTQQSQKRLQEILQYQKLVEEAEQWLYCAKKL